jgi:hypothetical protein
MLFCELIQSLPGNDVHYEARRYPTSVSMGSPPEPGDFSKAETLKAETLSKARNERVAGIRTRFSVVADQAAEEED